MCHVVSAGALRVFVKGADLGFIGEGAIFGELSLLYDVCASATVIAWSETTYFSLRRKYFKRGMRSASIQRRQEIFDCINSCSLFKVMGEREISRLSDRVQWEEYASHGTTRVIVEEVYIDDAYIYIYIYIYI